MIAALSKKYESGANPGAVGFIRGDTGGTSYGQYQIIAKNMPDFLENELKQYAPKAYEKLSKLKPYIRDAQGPFAQTWKQIADEGLLGDAEHKYIERTHYKPQYERLPEHLKAVVDTSPTLKNVLWSTAVQHRNTAPGIMQTAWESSDKSLEGFINRIYSERATRFPTLQKSNPNAWRGIQNRMSKYGELGDALEMLANERATMDLARFMARR